MLIQIYIYIFRCKHKTGFQFLMLDYDLKLSPCSPQIALESEAQEKAGKNYWPTPECSLQEKTER